MTSRYHETQEGLRREPRTWLVTGVAGFIGSHLLEALLRLNQPVVGVDNLLTGHQRNLDEVCEAVGPERWSRFRFMEGDICDLEVCRSSVEGVRHVLHQAALGSVPRSVADPLTTNAVNVTGFLNMLVAARDAGVGSFVYAASSSTYGDDDNLPKREERIGRPLSPYAVTKYVNELYADVFGRTYGFYSTGLRYFNVFGPRQDPLGPYAAVIPRWMEAMSRNEDVCIYGDGETSRDFCYVDNAVQANLLAALAGGEAVGQVYNVAVNGRTTLNGLFSALARVFSERGNPCDRPPRHESFRAGDVRHSQADIARAQRLLGYSPSHTLEQGLGELVDWYIGQAAGPNGPRVTSLA